MRFYEIITETVNRPFWIKDDGTIVEVAFQKHASTAAHLLNIDFDRKALNNTVTGDEVYDAAFSHGWVRVDISQSGRGFYISFSPDIAKKARRVLLKTLKEHDDTVQYIHIDVYRFAATNEMLANQSFETVSAAIRMINKVGKSLK